MGGVGPHKVGIAKCLYLVAERRKINKVTKAAYVLQAQRVHQHLRPGRLAIKGDPGGFRRRETKARACL